MMTNKKESLESKVIEILFKGSSKCDIIKDNLDYIDSIKECVLDSIEVIRGSKQDCNILHILEEIARRSDLNTLFIKNINTIHKMINKVIYVIGKEKNIELFKTKDNE